MLSIYTIKIVKKHGKQFCERLIKSSPIFYILLPLFSCVGLAGPLPFIAP
jgi:hypothetical protein